MSRHHLSSSFRVALIASAAVVVFSGCSDKSQTPKGVVKAGSRDVVVARLGAVTITAGQVVDALARQPPYVRMRFTSLDRKKAFLEKLLRFEVLVAEAKRRGLSSHPDVVRRKNRAMVDMLLRKLNKELVSFDDVTEAEIKARYERDKAKYQRPAQARGAVVVLSTEAEAKKVLADVAEKKGNPRYFAKICSERNKDPEFKKKAGDLGFFAADDKKPSKALRDAVFALSQVGRIAGPLKVKGGWALVMKTGKQPALNHPLARVRDEIKNKLFHEKRFKAVTGYADKLRKKAKLEIDEAKLAAVKVPLSKPKRVKGLLTRPGFQGRRPMTIPSPGASKKPAAKPVKPVKQVKP